MQFSKIKNLIFLSLIIVAAFFSRIILLSNFPPSLNWDEVSLGYNAYSLIKTGHDEWGVAFPTIFRAFGDYKLPGYVYFSVLNPFNIRLTSAIFGTILVLATYLISKNKFAALLAAFSPWSWFLSRIALEANVATSIFSIGIALYLSNLSPVITTIFLTLPVWVYNSYRVFVPLILVPLWLINRKKISLITALIILIPMFGQMLLSSGQARFKWVSILDEGAIGRIIELRQNSKHAYPNLIYNRYTYFTSKFILNYLNHFHPKYLFAAGNTNYQFNIPNQGLIFLILAPFFYWGIYDIFKTKNRLLIAWLLLAPVASSLTKDSPHVLRSITLLPLPFILIANQLSKLKSKQILLLILFIFIGYWILYIGHWKNYRDNFSWSWQYGYPQLVDYISQHQSEYDQILITKRYGEPHIFFLYYQKYNPQQYINDPNLKRYFQTDWYWVDSFAKYHFINDWEFLNKTKNLDPDQKHLLISSTPIPATKLTEIKFLDGQTAFYIYEK